MGRSEHYKSPSKRKRNIRRLVSHLHQIILQYKNNGASLVQDQTMVDLKPVADNLSIDAVQNDALSLQPVPTTPPHDVPQPQLVADKPSEDVKQTEPCPVADVLTLEKFLEILENCKSDILKPP